MTEQECTEILNMHSVAIEAPAGCGKTEAIADMLLAVTGKQLVLTHTNAGVDSLNRRFKKKIVPTSQYSLQTIAAFCMRWCHSFPNTAQIKAQMTPQSDQNYYPMIYSGMSKILFTSWGKEIIRKTYTGIIVDEYQDCSILQHQVIIELSSFLPVRILGDPLQGIFGWSNDKMIVWKDIPFPVIHPLVTPWRWQNTAPELGSWIFKIRNVLLPALDGSSVHVELVNLPPQVQVQRLTGWRPSSCIGLDGITLLITNIPNRQKYLAKQSGGRFFYQEPLECNELFEFLRELENASGVTRIRIILELTDTCFSNFKTTYSAFFDKVRKGSLDFHKIRTHKEIEPFIQSFTDTAPFSYQSLLNWFSWVESLSGVNLHRRELIYEIKRCIKLSVESGDSCSTLAQKLRSFGRHQGNYLKGVRNICSRTVLSKGLEFDNVIIDMSTPLISAQDFYVALTRAMKKIIILSDVLEFDLNPQTSK